MRKKNLKKTDHADKKDEQVFHHLDLTALHKTTNSEICSYSEVQRLKSKHTKGHFTPVLITFFRCASIS